MNNPLTAAHLMEFFVLLFLTMGISYKSDIIARVKTYFKYFSTTTKKETSAINHNPKVLSR